MVGHTNNNDGTIESHADKQLTRTTLLHAQPSTALTERFRDCLDVG